MKDTAYTSLALGAHTDTTYFTDPAGLQMFHLLSHTDGEGGASLLVDGFRAARILQKESPVAFHILSEVPIPWHASGNEGITMTPAKKFPVLNFGTKGRKIQGRDLEKRELLQVRWNNDDRGVVDLDITKYPVEKWYAAARIFDAILKREDSQYWAQLEPGRPVIFDNWRVLHGRSAFTGKRRICGGYSEFQVLLPIFDKQTNMAKLTMMISSQDGGTPISQGRRFCSRFYDLWSKSSSIALRSRNARSLVRIENRFNLWSGELAV